MNIRMSIRHCFGLCCRRASTPSPAATRSWLIYGGVVYGSLPLGERFGTLDYRAYGGQRVAGSDDEYLQAYRAEGLLAPNGLSGPTFGETLNWNTPIEGLMLGASATSDRYSGAATFLGYPGTATIDHLRPYFLSGKYEHRKVMFAGEYNRFAGMGAMQFTGFPTIFQGIDDRAFYVMASYKVSSKLSAGCYYSSVFDHLAAYTPARYQKDWVISSRYDFSPFVYLKLEEHVMDGVLRGFSPSNNADGLKPDTRMTLLKLGVSF